MRTVPADATYSGHPDVVALSKAADALTTGPSDTILAPGVALALAAALREIAWMGAYDADQLHRIGCPELVRVARAILLDSGGERD